MSKHVRTELRSFSDDRDKDFKILFAKFRKAVSDAGVIQDIRSHERYETEGEKNRRRKKEAEVARLKAKLKENFPKKKEN